MMAGWYGVFACEAMALKKPVCVYIRDDLEAKYLPSRPIINVNPSNITEKLKLLIHSRDLRRTMADTGYRYVNEVHDAVRIARMVTGYYEI